MLTALRRRAVVLLVATALLAACSSSGDAGSDDEGEDPPAGDALEVPSDAEEVGDPDGTAYEAVIRRTEGGVPHITGATMADVSFGQGWASGEDRACDLADQVVKISSERARWFGPGTDDANIDSDFAWKAIGIRQIAEADWTEASDDVTGLLTAYTDGWNAHLADVGADGLNDWCAGEEWVRPLEPVEVYAYARSIALQASSGAVSNLLATAQPPVPAGPADPAGEPAPEVTPSAAPAGPAIDPVTASNGWAIGAERSADGGGLLVANPHFPWEGELRFWEVQLTIPGEMDAYGVQLSGLPGIGIGFTDTFAWTHTVSAGKRFTAYRLDLVEGSPTSYRYGDEVREMTAEDHTIEVLGDDGGTTEVSRTLYRSHYGPILDFPGFGWSTAGTITMRDANITNDEFVEQYLAMVQAPDLDAFIDTQREITGVPLFNTIAVSDDGRAWYGDTSATPALSDEAITAYEAALETDPIVGVAADNGAVLLDGSDPLYEWQDLPGARDPGLVPFDDMPMVERDDYVFNANDSFWVPHATELLAGDYSPLHGRQDTARSPRTRENALVLDDTGDDGPSGTDGFTLDELADAALLNEGFTARELRAEVVERCTGAAPVAVPALTGDDGAEVLPAATVDVAAACAVLADWDGIYDTDQAGPPLWRELMARYERASFGDAGELWATPFDPADPVGTPSGLAPAPTGAPDPLLERLARAVQVLALADAGPDVTLGDLQAADRNGTLVPIHGGDGRDGTTNVVGWGRGWSIMDPDLAALERETLAPGSTLATVTGADGKAVTGYRINNGTSFLLAVAFGPDGPQAKAFLTYGNTADRSDPTYTEATEAFGAKAWHDVAWTPEDVEAATTETLVVGVTGVR